MQSAPARSCASAFDGGRASGRRHRARSHGPGGARARRGGRRVAATTFVFDEYPIGAAAIRQYGTPLPSSTLDACCAADAVLLGRGGRSSVRSPAARSATGGRIAGAAGCARRLRQPATGPHRSCARGRHAVSRRMRRRRGRADRARAARRPLLRSPSRRQPRGRAQHDALHARRDRPRRPCRVRSGAQPPPKT